MNPPLSIRRYESNDLEQCRSLWRELTERHREIYEDPTIGGEHPENHFDKHLAEVEPNNLWVATSNSKIVGLVGLITKEKAAEIEPLIVSKTHRHKGIGKQLLNNVIAEAKKVNIQFLTVKPVARNIHAIKFFYKQGFKTLGEIELCLDFCNYKWKPGLELFECKFHY